MVLLFANIFIVKPLVGVLNSVCIFTTILFIIYNPSEGRRFIINLKRFIFGYNLGLLGYRFLLLLILQVPAEEWNRIYNINPGYLTSGGLYLASHKGKPHRQKISDDTWIEINDFLYSVYPNDNLYPLESVIQHFRYGCYTIGRA